MKVDCLFPIAAPITRGIQLADVVGYFDYNAAFPVNFPDAVNLKPEKIQRAGRKNCGKTCGAKVNGLSLRLS